MSLTVDREPDLETVQQDAESRKTRPVRVCFMIDELGVAGTEKHLLSLIERLDRTKVAPHLCLLDGGSAASRQLEPADCPVYRMGVRSLLSFHAVSSARRFMQWLRMNRIEVLQTIFPDSTYFGIPLARAAGVPVTLRTRRNTGYWMNTKHRLLGRVISRLTTATIANSEACKLSVIEDECAEANSVFVIPNGVDISRFPQRQWGEATEGQVLRIGALANLRPVKNLLLLIKAAALIVKKHKRVHFQIAGEGPLRPHLQAEIEQLGLEASFELMGSISNVAGFLEELDVAVLCSLSEGMSNTLIEYKAASLPIVATNVGGNRQLISDEKEGLLIPADNVDALANAIDRLLVDRELAQRLGTAARASAELNHCSQAEVATYERLYTRLCESRLVFADQENRA